MTTTTTTRTFRNFLQNLSCSFFSSFPSSPSNISMNLLSAGCQLHTRNFPQKKTPNSTLHSAAVADDDQVHGQISSRGENSFTSMDGGCRLLLPMCVVGTASLPLTRGHENVWFSALRATREKWFFALLSAHSTALLAIVGWLWLLSCCCCCCCGGPFQRFQCGEQQSGLAHTRTRGVVGSRFHAESHFTRAESAAGRTRTLCCSVAQTNRRGKGRRTFENQISGVYQEHSLTGCL